MLHFFAELSFWDWLDVIGLFFVFAGVVGEVIVPRIKFSAAPIKRADDVDEIAPILAQRASLRTKWESKMAGWLHWSEIVLVIGLALELVAMPFHFKEAGESKRIAGEAKERAALTESNNLVLRSNVVALELKLRPRVITPTQVTNFIFLTKKIHKIPITICTGMNGDLSYALHLRDMFSAAGFPATNVNSSFGIRIDNARATLRPPGQSYEWPQVMAIRHGTNNPTMVEAYPYRFEIANGVSRPITVNTNDKTEICNDLMIALKDVGISVQTWRTDRVGPDDFEFEIPAKNY